MRFNFGNCVPNNDGWQDGLEVCVPDGWQYSIETWRRSHATNDFKQRFSLLNNAVYRAYRYVSDYPGLQKYDLTPGDAIELYE